MTVSGKPMSCLSELRQGSDGVVACALAWITDDKIFPTFGAYVSATVIFLTFLATLRLTRTLKRSDSFIDFTKTFNQFMVAREALLELPIPSGQTGPTDALEAKALNYYGQFYAFIFSEYYAYKIGSLDRQIFTLWMRSQWREFHAPQAGDILHGKSYSDGWNYWRQHFHRGASDSFTRLIEDIRQCRREHRVSGLVRKHGPNFQRLCWLVQWLFVESGWLLSTVSPYLRDKLRAAHQ